MTIQQRLRSDKESLTIAVELWNSWHITCIMEYCYLLRKYHNYLRERPGLNTPFDWAPPFAVKKFNECPLKPGKGYLFGICNAWSGGHSHSL